MFSSSQLYTPVPSMDDSRPIITTATTTSNAGDADADSDVAAMTSDHRMGLARHDHHVIPRHVPVTYHHIEQARTLTWTDPFYDGKPGIIAAFDRDGISAGSWVMWRLLGVAIVFWSFSIWNWILGAMRVNHDVGGWILDDMLGVYTFVLGIFVAIGALRGRQSMLSQHVAITNEGIRVDYGTMLTLTIPFEHVQKIDVKPYQFCSQAYEGQFAVMVHRSAVPFEQLCCQKTKQVDLYGLIQPQRFADLVLALKDSQDQGTYEGLEIGFIEERRLDLQPMQGANSTTSMTIHSTRRISQF